MVTTKLIGGLGNQLFQMAMLFSFAKDNRLDYVIPKTVIQPHIKNRKAYIFPGFKYTDNNWNLSVIQEKSFCYEEIMPIDNVCFSGYWQSWKYFDHNRNELLDAIGIYGKTEKGVVAIHVRRGNYLMYQDHHPPVSTDYINAAMMFFKQHGYFKFKVFSDDPDWCRENVTDKTSDFEWREGGNEIDDLRDISCCEHLIGSNSSFSWWGNYLNRNENKIGVFPEKWFGPMLPHDTKDLHLKNSILL